MFLPALILALTSPVFGAKTADQANTKAQAHFQKSLWDGARTNTPMQVQMAAQSGANVNYVYPDGSTALTTAIASKAEAAALKLIELGANPNLAWDGNQKFKHAPDGPTPLFLATVHIMPTVVVALVKAGAEITDNALGVAEQAAAMGGFDKSVVEWMKKNKK